MNEATGGAHDGPDIGEYCRRVEEHLTRVNDGHLVRIVGPGFELVRRWAIEQVPLSVVIQGIALKAERHRAGRSKRPLRVEFCEHDVQAVYDGWRRAVGVFSDPVQTASDAEPVEADARRLPALSRHLDRVLERLSRVAGRLDRSEAFRDAVGGVMADLAQLRDEARGARGGAKAELVERLPAIDARLMDAARVEAGDALLGRLRQDAGGDLSSFRGRLSEEAWQRSLRLGTDRLLRDDFGLPTVELA